MKLNQLLIAVSFFCMSTLIYPVHFPAVLKAIICIERYEKPGYPTIDLLHDHHGFKSPEQEAAITKMLSQHKGHVYVEDVATSYDGIEHTESNIHQIPKSLLNNFIVPGSLAGLVLRLKSAGISASSVEIRNGLSLKTAPPALLRNIGYHASNKEVFANYRKIRSSLKVENPASSIDKFGNELMEKTEKAEDAYLNSLSEGSSLDGERDIGLHAFDLLALKQLCNKDGNARKALISGFVHCGDIGFSLVEQLGYKRTKCLGGLLKEDGTKVKIINGAYESFLLNKNSAYIRDGLSTAVTTSIVPPQKIEKYFEKTDSYKAS